MSQWIRGEMNRPGMHSRCRYRPLCEICAICGLPDLRSLLFNPVAPLVAARPAQHTVLYHEPIRPNPVKSDQIRLKKVFMTATRKGKIARLPKAIRDELNRRLSDGELGTALVDWLNSLPGVQRIVADEFGGRAVRPQNLSEWRKGGYREWLQTQQAAELVRHPFAEAADLKSAVHDPSDKLGTWLAARYAVATQHMAREGNGQLDWEQLREMCRDVSALRRGDHHAERLKLEQARLELGRARKGGTELR